MRAGIQPARMSAIQPPMLEPTRTCGPSVSRSDGVAGVVRPVADAAGEEVAGGGAVAGVVEAQVGLAAGARPGLEEMRLGAGHVGAEAAEEDDARPAPLAAAIGDAAAVGQVEHVGVHARS